MRKKTGKRIICVILIICTALCITLSVSSCAPTGSDDDNASIKILCTLFPQYDWIRSITKGVDGVEVSIIISNGTDPHSYQPTAADIMNISKCDALVYVGGDSDTWVKKAIERSKNKEMKLIALTELEGIRLHDISSSSHSHEGHSHEGHSHEGHSHSALDEHLYLSLENAITSVKAITEWLCAKDEENAERYIQNSSEYILKLTALGNSFKSDVEQVPEEKRFILFADRFPFVYLLSDYGIHYSAAFEGCTTDVDADFDTVIRLIHEANEHNVGFIAVTEGSDKSLASTVISSTNSKNQEIIVLNSLQSITQKQIEKGATYLSLMEENIKELKRALGIKN
jgi:zinc transport system substrate-binding protein